MTARARHRSTVIGWLAAWRLARWLPERLARTGVDRLTDEAWRRRAGGVGQLERNLARVLGCDPAENAVRQLSREAMRSYGRYWLEAFRLPDWDREEVLARATVDGWDMITAAIGERGAVVALPHMGNWDLAGAWASASGVPVTAVAERLEPAALYERFLKFRGRIGIEVVPLGQADLMSTLVQRAGDHRLVTLVTDRDFGSGGVDVTFFGEPARMPVGAATVALRAAVPLFPVTLWYEDLARVRVHEPVPVPGTGSERTRVEAMTRSVARVFEGAVRAHPADWHMLQRVWLADRTPGARHDGSVSETES